MKDFCLFFFVRFKRFGISHWIALPFWSPKIKSILLFSVRRNSLNFLILNEFTNMDKCYTNVRLICFVCISLQFRTESKNEYMTLLVRSTSYIIHMHVNVNHERKHPEIKLQINGNRINWLVFRSLSIVQIHRKIVESKSKHRTSKYVTKIHLQSNVHHCDHRQYNGSCLHHWQRHLNIFLATENTHKDTDKKNRNWKYEKSDRKPNKTREQEQKWKRNKDMLINFQWFSFQVLQTNKNIKKKKQYEIEAKMQTHERQVSVNLTNYYPVLYVCIFMHEQ